MEKMKEFFKNNAGMIIAVVAIAFVVWYFFLRKKKAESNWASYQLDPEGIESNWAVDRRGRAAFFRNTGGTPVPQGRWVSSQEGGKSYCRWYDSHGNNTVTYDRPCTKAQANMPN